MLMKTPQRYSIETVPVAAWCINPLQVYHWKGAIRPCWYTAPPNSCWKKKGSTETRVIFISATTRAVLNQPNPADCLQSPEPPTTEWGWSGSAPSVRDVISQFLRCLIWRCWCWIASNLDARWQLVHLACLTGNKALIHFWSGHPDHSEHIWLRTLWHSGFFDKWKKKTNRQDNSYKGIVLTEACPLKKKKNKSGRQTKVRDVRKQEDKNVGQHWGQE